MIKIEKSTINGKIIAQPSKSHEQRLLVACLLSRGECIIENSGNSDDVKSLRNIISIIGSNIRLEENKTILTPSSNKEEQMLNCGESAMNARLITPIASLYKNVFTILGEASLLKRPIAEDFYIFKQMGCKLSNESTYLPIEFTNANLIPGTYNIDGSKSSQLVSGLMMSLAVLPADSELIVHNAVSIPYLELTKQVMQSFGVKCNIHKDNYGSLNIRIPGNQIYQPGKYSVEGDWSGALNFMIAGALSAYVEVQGLNQKSLQADRKILDVFDIAKVNYKWESGVIKIDKSDIKAFSFDATNCPDLIPAIIVLACFADDTCIISGASRLMHKESSRAEVMKKELAKAGADIKLELDDIIVSPKKIYNPADFNSHNDHRIAMALAIFSLNIGNCTIDNFKCVDKSWPVFFEDLESIGVMIF